MNEYLVIARRFRPKNFKEVLGQDAIVKTLKNAIKRQRLATAYLFCGSRGTGKTTLARVFAKALNCANPTEDLEPCNECPSCKEIAASTSLDVIEIDGASHRGIDDIRQINETVGYAPASGKYKIYIIDEVHMLTKEAFNALLKTLEEPPPKVKFFFATTEAHKVLPTILSRCQRFNLNRIPLDVIVEKLAHITDKLNVTADREALQLIAKRAEGGLRDAESLMDQMIAFHEGPLTASTVTDILGIMPRNTLFSLDQAGHKGDYAHVFTLTDQLFSQGKDFVHFIEMLIEHIRTLLLIKLSAAIPPSIHIPETEREAYLNSAKLYSVEQCMTILELLAPAISEIRFSPTPRFTLEALLLKMLRTHCRIPIDTLVRRLAELEEKAAQLSQNGNVPLQAPAVTPSSASSSKIEEFVEPVYDESPPPPPPSQPAPTPPPKQSIAAPVSKNARPQHRYDTLLQFAAVELEGSVQIKKIHRQALPST